MSLKSKRVERGIMQRKAAETFGLKYRTCQNYENGVTNSTRRDTKTNTAGR